MRADGTMHVVLLVRLDLRDKKEEWFFLLLAKEALHAISNEVDAIFVFVGDLLAVAVPDGSFVRVRSVFDYIRSFPQVEEAATELRFNSTGASAVGLIVRGKMPLANQVCGIAGFAQISGQRREGLAQSKAVVPDAGL